MEREAQATRLPYVFAVHSIVFIIKVISQQMRTKVLCFMLLVVVCLSRKRVFQAASSPISNKQQSYTHSNDDDNSHEDDGHNHNAYPASKVKWEQGEIWFWGLIAGGAVSLIGFFAAFMLIIFKRFSSQGIFTVLIHILLAFSCGALIGDVMLHILPEAYKSRHTTQLNVSLVFIASILSFIGLQRFMEYIHISHSHWQDNEHTAQQLQNNAVTEKRQLEKQNKKSKPHKKQKQEKQSTGYLNLISSLVHNFVDGLAVGVAFSLGNPNEFIPVTFGIIAHEIPREMGDVSILMKSHFSDKEIILSNGFVNCISIVGVILGLNSTIISPTIRQYVLVYVGGNFMYIAADIWRNLFRQKQAILNLLQLVGFIMGVYLTMSHSHSH